MIEVLVVDLLNDGIVKDILEFLEVDYVPCFWVW